MRKILVLEDELSIRSFVVLNLKRSGYLPIEAGTGTEALELARKHPDIRIALLDVMLPDIDGFEVCRRLRASNSGMGIIMLTARSQEMDKITGLMTGADDYVTKPFSPGELMARIDALYRRVAGDELQENELTVQGPFVLNEREHSLEKRGEPIRLTHIEYSMLKYFMANRNLLLSREDILAAIWGEKYNGDIKIVDVNIRRLRKKIEDDSNAPVYLTTVWGRGYKWNIVD